MLIEELNFSVRTYNALKRAGIHTAEEISGKSNGDLQKLRGIGRNAIREIRGKVPRKAYEVAPVACSGDHMALWKAIGLLVKEYEKALNLEYVRKPLAWALYHVWKMVDEEK